VEYTINGKKWEIWQWDKLSVVVQGKDTWFEGLEKIFSAVILRVPQKRLGLGQGDTQTYKQHALRPSTKKFSKPKTKNTNHRKNYFPFLLIKSPLAGKYFPLPGTRKSKHFWCKQWSKKRKVLKKIGVNMRKKISKYFF
jgi:hypothetical protein